MRLRVQAHKAASMLWSLMLLLGLGSRPAHAAESAATFESANRLYEQGKFKDAGAAYQELLQSGQVSAAIYFNLGNACFKAGELGRAISAYRQAELLTPRDPDLRANLQFARNQVQGPTLTPTLWQRSLGRLTLNEWTFATMAAVWVLFLVLTVRQWQPAWGNALRVYVSAAAAAALLLGAGFAGRLQEARYSPAAVVTARDAVVRQGPLDEAQTAFVVHDGAELNVLDQKDNWLQVSADQRRFGWMRRDQLIVLPGA